MFFRKMTEKEKENSEKGIRLGFFVYAVLLAFSSYQYISDKEITLSPVLIFLVGIIASLVYEGFLNLKDKMFKQSTKKR